MKQEISKADEVLISEWLNCHVAEVDDDGDVWVAEPMTGHWLTDEDKAAYLEWREA